MNILIEEEANCEVKKMKKRSMCIGAKHSFFAVFVSMLFLSVCVTHASALPATVAVHPLTLTIDEVGEIGTVNITVSNVVDLYAWSVKIFFDETTLNRTAAWLPEDHVFSYTNMNYFAVSPRPGEPEWGTGYVVVGNTLIGPEPTFNGSGTLCQINFTGIAEGSSLLTVEPIQTFLLDNAGLDITFGVTGGEVTVISEILTFTITPLFMILTLLTVTIAKRKRSNNQMVKVS